MTRNSLLALALLFAANLAPRIAHAADSKISFVDLARAIQETDDGKKAKAKLKAEFDKKQQELDVKQQELQKMKDELDKKATVLTTEAKQKAQKEFQDRFSELQATFQRLQEDLGKREQDATRPIVTGIQTVVGKIAERDHLGLVLEKSAAVVWGQPALDITNEVIRMYNAGAGGTADSKAKK